MDIKSTKGLASDVISRLIEENEAAHPSRKRENDSIRAWLSVPGNRDRIMAVAQTLDIDAALISDCRTDSLNCGLCTYRMAALRL